MIYEDMRDAFFEELFKIMKKDKNVILLLGDQGAKSLDKFFSEIPEQVLNCGPMEQNLINVAAGLAHCGKQVFVHGITPFVTLRCFEQICLSLGLTEFPVTIVGIGTGISFWHEGPTHHAINDISIMSSIPNMNVFCPSDADSLSNIINITHKNKKLNYVRFDHKRLPFIEKHSKHNFNDGMIKLKEGFDNVVISTGNLVHNALNIKNVEVIDIYKIFPLNKSLLLKYLKGKKKVLVLEEHLKYGGLGTKIADFICDNNLNIKFKRIGFEQFIQDYGPREKLLKRYLK